MNKISLEQFQFFNGHLIEMNMRIPTKIEEGGQGVFVKLLSECLTKMGIEHKLYYFCDKDQPLEIKHIVARVANNLFLGARGAHHGPLFAYKDLVHREVTFEELKMDADNPEEWSPVFDRSLIPDIEKQFENIPFEYGDYLAGKKDYEKILCDLPIIQVNEYTQEQMAKERSMAAVRRLNQIFDGLHNDENTEVIRVKKRRKQDDEDDNN